MLKIGDRFISADDFQAILLGEESIEISEQAKERVEKSFRFLESFYQNKVIYGINTGLGPMAQYKIDEDDRINLQYNAIRSHAAGSGSPVDPLYVRSSLIVLLNNLLKGNSGIYPEVVFLILEFINRGITPVVPEHGGVGASGDLVQMAHIALSLIGEGEVVHEGKRVPAARVFATTGLKPATVRIREGLSLINGTCFMTGTGVVNIIHARNLISWTILACAMINEVVSSFDDSFSKELNQVKLHEGQNDVAGIMRKILADSGLISKREEFLYNGETESKPIMTKKVQEYYSIRCVPQIIGPILDTLRYTEKVVLNEANSSCDNPVIDHVNRNIFHGGNFHGDYVSFEMDKLKIAVTKLSLLIDRQINFLMNDKLNGILPPFVNLGKLGVNFGMQGAQFTSTSTVAENQSLSFPHYLHSIPNNNDNQDIVSMGTNAALMTKRVIDNSFQVLAIEMLSLIQAVDYLRIDDRLSAKTKVVYSGLRKVVPKFGDDTIKYFELEKIKDYICSHYINL